MTREKLEGLFARRWPELSRESPHEEYWPWFKRNAAFRRLLRIGTDEAFLAAAMMCRPEGWHVAEMGEHYDYPLRALGPWFAVLVQKMPRMNDGGSGGPADPYSRCLHAPTPAEALIAAIEKAMNDE